MLELVSINHEEQTATVRNLPMGLPWVVDSVAARVLRLRRQDSGMTGDVALIDMILDEIDPLRRALLIDKQIEEILDLIEHYGDECVESERDGAVDNAMKVN